METIICKKCNEELLIEAFYTNKTGYLGRDCYCKRCRISYNKSRKERSNSIRREKMRTDFEYRNKVLSQKRYSHRKHYKIGMLNKAKQRAKKYNLEFNLTIEDIIIPEYCPLIEIPLYPGIKGDYHNSPSIDRIDNSKGYVKNNIRVISTLANSMKNAASIEQLKTFSKNIIKYLETD